MLERPFFRRQLHFHFRPKVFGRGENGAPITDPHGKKPRSSLAGWAKLVFYFVDQLSGYLLKVFPAKVRNELIIFCRDFDDVLIDPHRYRFPNAGWLARCLRRFLPRTDLTIVLDAEPEQIVARKAELSLEEMRRQRRALRDLSAESPRYVLVSAAPMPDAVARAACRGVIQFLAERVKRREAGLPVLSSAAHSSPARVSL